MPIDFTPCSLHTLIRPTVFKHCTSASTTLLPTNSCRTLRAPGQRPLPRWLAGWNLEDDNWTERQSENCEFVGGTQFITTRACTVYYDTVFIIHIWVNKSTHSAVSLPTRGPLWRRGWRWSALYPCYWRMEILLEHHDIRRRHVKSLCSHIQFSDKGLYTPGVFIRTRFF